MTEFPPPPVFPCEVTISSLSSGEMSIPTGYESAFIVVKTTISLVLTTATLEPLLTAAKRYFPSDVVALVRAPDPTLAL